MAEISLPKELAYGMPPQLSGISSFEYRVPTYTNLAQWQPGSTAQLQIAQMPNIFLDPSTAYLSMKVRVSVALKADGGYNGVSANTGPLAYICGSGWSLINRLSTYFNSGVLLDDMMYVNVAVNTMRNMMQDQASKFGDSVVWGGQDVLTGPNVGIPICGTAPYEAIVAADQKSAYQDIELALPLPGFLGQGSAGKLIPAFVGPMRLDLQMEQLQNWFVCDGVNVLGITGISVSRLEFVCSAVRLSDEMMRVVESSLPAAGQISIRSNQIIGTTIPIPAGTSGFQTYLNGTRAQSVKAIIHNFNDSTMIDKIFGSINPNASQITVDINSVLYPQQGGDITKPADAFARMLQAIGVWSTTGGKPAFGGNSFYRSQTADTPVTVFAGGVSTIAASYLAGNCFYNFTDVESFGSKGSGSGFFSGQSTVGTGSFLRVQFAAAVPNGRPITVYAFSLIDCVITYDLASRSAIRRF